MRKCLPPFCGGLFKTYRSVFIIFAHAHTDTSSHTPNTHSHLHAHAKSRICPYVVFLGKFAEQVREAGAAPAIVKLMECTDVRVKMQAAGVLFELARASSKYFVHMCLYICVQALM